MKNTFFRKRIIVAISTLWMFSPLLVFGQNFTWLQNVIDETSGLVALVIPLLVGLALMFFIWGLVVFIMNSGNEQERQVGKQKMIWGIVALFVIVSVWGIVRLLQTITAVTGGKGSLAPPAIL